MSLMHHTFTDQEKLHLVNGDPYAFVEGLMSAPGEASSYQEVAMNREEASYKSAAYLIGYALGEKLALKNGKVKIAEGVKDE